MNVCVLVASVGWYLWVHGEKSPSSSLARRTSDELCVLHDVDMFRLAVYNLTLVECFIMPSSFGGYSMVVLFHREAAAMLARWLKHSLIPPRIRNVSSSKDRRQIDHHNNDLLTPLWFDMP